MSEWDKFDKLLKVVLAYKPKGKKWPPKKKSVKKSAKKSSKKKAGQ